MHIELTRPKALNALNPGMIQTLWSAYADAAADAEVKCMVMTGAGGKAFCAGGDVRAIWDAARPGGTAPGGSAAGTGEASVADSFFRTEYALNFAVAGSPIPQVSLWDGIVMGGGVGVSVHGAFRVATEKAMFAMPETGIGLFPDVGGSHFLSRLPGELGAYIGLSGVRLGAADLLYSQLATHAVSSDALPELEAALQACGSADEVGATLDRFSAAAPAELREGGALAAAREEIDAAFSASSCEEIISRLEGGGSDWSKKTAKTLGRMSPTSMKITLRLMREARGASLDECLRREFRVVSRCVHESYPDFFEGIRAALVDKDRSPVWSPPTLEQAGAALIDQYFAPLAPERELDMPRLKGFRARL